MLNTKILSKLISDISDQVEGDWLLFGGTVLYAVGIDTRSTYDIDIASFNISTNEDTLKLMTLAEKLNLPVETINQAGAFFLSAIKDWQTQTVLLKKGKKGSVYRPNLELYFNLKTNRLSDSDLNDCITYLKWHKSEKISYDSKKLKKVITSKKKVLSEESLARLSILLDEL